MQISDYSQKTLTLLKAEGYFSYLPVEVKGIIFSFTDENDLLLTSMLNKKFTNMYGFNNQINKLKIFISKICEHIKDDAPAIYDQLNELLIGIDEEIKNLPFFNLLPFLKFKRNQIIDNFSKLSLPKKF